MVETKFLDCFFWSYILEVNEMIFQVGCYSFSTTRKNWQWDQELMEYPPQETPPLHGTWSSNTRTLFVSSLPDREFLAGDAVHSPHGAVGERKARSWSSPLEGVLALHESSTSFQGQSWLLSMPLELWSRRIFSKDWEIWGRENGMP